MTSHDSIISGSSVPQQPKADERPAPRHAVQLVGVDDALDADEQLHVAFDAVEPNASLDSPAGLIAATGDRLVDA